MDARRFQRVPFHARTSVSMAGSSWDCTLLNIALKGALLESAALPLEHGALCDIAIILPSTEISLGFQAKLVHREGNHYGFKFQRVDLQTLTHLRKLLELNTGDADGVRGELMSWLEEGERSIDS